MCHVILMVRRNQRPEWGGLDSPKVSDPNSILSFPYYSHISLGNSNMGVVRIREYYWGPRGPWSPWGSHVQIPLTSNPGSRPHFCSSSCCKCLCRAMKVLAKTFALAASWKVNPRLFFWKVARWIRHKRFGMYCLEIIRVHDPIYTLCSGYLLGFPF